MSSSIRRRRPDRRVAGFTLIELMIAVAIVAILAAIVYPSYMGSVWKGRRGEAKAAILRALQAEERYFTQNNTYFPYATQADLNANPASGTTFPLYSADNANNSTYTVKALATGAAPLCTVNSLTQCIVITATVTGKVDPLCGSTLSMDSIGNKASTTGNAACWK